VGRLIHTDALEIPRAEDLAREIAAAADKKRDPGRLAGLADLWQALEELGARYGLEPGRREVRHPFKRYSVQEACFARGVPLTVHPGLGHDIIHASPFCRFAALGRAAETDFLRFVASVAELDGGVYLSVGSAIMSPMVFEKSLSMARNVARQEGRALNDFLLVVNDIQPGGGWQWGSGAEPGKDNPAYYLRFCKTFDRMGAREMRYAQADNRAFLLNLYAELKRRDANAAQEGPDPK
jgi:hypothetical protein